MIVNTPTQQTSLELTARNPALPAPVLGEPRALPEKVQALVPYLPAELRTSGALRCYQRTFLSRKLREYPDKEGRIQIGLALKQIYSLVGIKPEAEPDRDTARRFATYIHRYLAGSAPEDLVEAFELALAGEFAAETRHYGVFSIEYLMGVYRPYAAYRQRQAVAVQKALDQAAERINVFKSFWKSRALDDETTKAGLMQLYSEFLEGKEDVNFRLSSRGTGYWVWLRGMEGFWPGSGPGNRTGLVLIELSQLEMVEIYEQVRKDYPSMKKQAKSKEWHISSVVADTAIFTAEEYIRAESQRRGLRRQMEIWRERKLTPEQLGEYVLGKVCYLGHDVWDRLKRLKLEYCERMDLL